MTHSDVPKNVISGSMLSKDDKGTYILVIELSKTQNLRPGKLPRSEFKYGMYLYIGRDRRALQARLKRHLRKDKKTFWHIDYLLKKAQVKEIWIKKDFFDECETASQIREFSPFVLSAQQGFGSSDCGCPGHLFYCFCTPEELKSLRKHISFEKVELDENQTV
jgi:Uri superfamily endonuclease